MLIHSLGQKQYNDFIDTLRQELTEEQIQSWLDEDVLSAGKTCNTCADQIGFAEPIKRSLEMQLTIQMCEQCRARGPLFLTSV